MSQLNNNMPPEREIAPEEIIPEERPIAADGQMRTITQVIVRGEGSIGQPIVDRVETTGLGEGGMSELTQVILTYAPGCHHLMHTGAEAGATCGDCSLLLCASCAGKEENLCHTCRRPVAGPCHSR